MMEKQKYKRLRITHPEKVDMNPAKLGQAFEIVEEGVKKKVYPGAVALVARHGVIVGEKYYGKAVLFPKERDMQVDTIFDLASLTKPIVTASSTMVLIEQGKLRLDDKVVDFVPEFKREAVTIRYLLTHTSGLPAWKDFYSESRSYQGIIREICQTELEYSPGTRVVYSCIDFILLGEITQRIARKSLALFSKENIFTALGMNNTFFNPLTELKGRIAATEYCLWRKRMLVGEVHDENAYALGGISGNAGLFSTAYDLAIFCQMLLNKGGYDKTQILGASTIEEMTRNQTEGLSEPWGLGWLLKSGKGSPAGDLLSTASYGHTGFTGTSLWIDPVRDLFIILLTNRVHPNRRCGEEISRIRPLFNDAVVGSIMEI